MLIREGKLLNDDCLNILKKIPDSSIDFIPEGKLIGKILNLCLAYVIDGTVDNTKEDLFKVANMLFTANPTLYNTGGQTND